LIIETPEYDKKGIFARSLRLKLQKNAVFRGEKRHSEKSGPKVHCFPTFGPEIRD